MIWLILFRIYAKLKVHILEDKQITVQDYALRIKGIPSKGTQESDLKEYLESNFGKIKEITYARRFNGMLS